MSEDTVDALQYYLQSNNIREGALFRSFNATRQLRGRLSVNAITQVFKRMAKVAGYNPNGVSGHSCRVGMAQDLSLAGISTGEIAIAGRWSSEQMPIRYAKKKSLVKGAVAKYHAGR
ncbi:hypothetical protein CCP3SC1AL1_3450005 [Gammaproteobacteria bacterium]